MNISEHKFYISFIYIWLIYLLYSLVLTFYNFSNLQRIEWKDAEYRTNVYSSRRSTTITYKFIKDNVVLSRVYPGILEGVSTWLWDIDKKAEKQDIFLFIRKKDYNKIETKTIGYNKDILGNKMEQKSIPFFNLRAKGKSYNGLLLYLDLWKYNYDILIALFIIISPFLLFYVLKKMKISFSSKFGENKKVDNLLGTYLIIFFIVFFLNLLV